ncbi:MAG: hypothetical protein ACTJLL_02995, partial [Anaplasma sp.]
MASVYRLVFSSHVNTTRHPKQKRRVDSRKKPQDSVAVLPFMSQQRGATLHSLSFYQLPATTRSYYVEDYDVASHVAILLITSPSFSKFPKKCSRNNKVSSTLPFT